MLSMQEFGFYDEAPVAFAKIVKYIYYAHSLDVHYGDDGNSYLSGEAKWLMFNGLFEALKNKFGEKEEVANNLIGLVQSFQFGDPNAKFERDFLVHELKRLSNDLQLCHMSAERRYENGIRELRTGIAELTEKFLDRRQAANLLK